MTDRVVALGGPPGSGKSTAGRLAAATLGLEYLSAGARFRAEAERRGISLAALGALAEGDAAIDRALDTAMLDAARPGRLVDGRIVGALCRRRGIPVDYLWVTAREEVRIARLAGRDREPLELCRARTVAREASERARYLAWYGIDLSEERPDLSIDSTELTPEVVAEAMVKFVRRPRSAP